MSLVRLRGVEKRYGDGGSEDLLVLREIDLRLDRGERLALIGPNGSGKTTLLRLILGQEEPTQGVIEIEAGVRLGYFSQFSELTGEQSIREVLIDLFAVAPIL